MLPTPKGDINITESLVKNLLDNQIHELSELPLKYLAEGWDNVMYRLGKDYLIRLPRRKQAATLIKNEQIYLNYLSNHLPINIPLPIYNGNPQGEYPWHWSVLPYFSGKAADISEIDANESIRLMDFLKRIHLPDNGAAPENEYRGGDLLDRNEVVIERLLSVKKHLPDYFPSIYRLWHESLKADKHQGNRWIHGDLHPFNVLVDHGRFSAIIDWGDITSGDVATDLSSIWLLFDDKNVRASAIASYDMDKQLIARSVGWAINFAAVFYQNGLTDNPRFKSIGEKTFKRLLEDFS